jgi:hypothetical protein
VFQFYLVLCLNVTIEYCVQIFQVSIFIFLSVVQHTVILKRSLDKSTYLQYLHIYCHVHSLEKHDRPFYTTKFIVYSFADHTVKGLEALCGMPLFLYIYLMLLYIFCLFVLLAGNCGTEEPFRTVQVVEKTEEKGIF